MSGWLALVAAMIVAGVVATAPGLFLVAAVTLGLYVDATVLGAEFMGYPLELRSVRWRERQTYAKRYRMTTLGLGVVISLFLFVPVVGSVLQATAVVGSVSLYHRWQREGREFPLATKPQPN